MTTLTIPSLPVSLIPSKISPPPKKELPVNIKTSEPETKDDGIDNESTTKGDDIVIDDDEPEPVEPESVDKDPDSVVVVMDDSTVLNADTLNNTLSLKQLRDRCTELGLNSAGKKMELAERIINH